METALCPCPTLTSTAKNFAPIQCMTDSKWKCLPHLKAALLPNLHATNSHGTQQNIKQAAYISSKMLLLLSVNKLSFVRFYTAYIALYQLQRKQVAFTIIIWKSAAQERHLTVLGGYLAKICVKKDEGRFNTSPN